MNNFLFRNMLLLFVFITSAANAQKAEKYNLSQLLMDNRLFINSGGNAKVVIDDPRKGVSVTGIVWLIGVYFSTGSIDVDIRGKDVFQQSFLGIAFHGVDTATYDAIYFRPFNFQSGDTLRQKHMVQYISQPYYPWDKLRKEHPLVYEQGITPAPLSKDWFHVHIVVGKEEVAVYVNHAKVPSLKVKKLNNRNDGLIGLWSSALSGDFANLEISPGPPTPAN